MSGIKTFDHKGVEISLHDSGKFTANGFNSSSLAGIKKLIDKKKEDSFQPFDAFDLRGWHSKVLKKVRVTSIEKPRSNARYGDMKKKWVCDDGAKDNVLYADNPKNEKALKAYCAFTQQTEKIKEEREQKAREMLAELEQISPE